MPASRRHCGARSCRYLRDKSAWLRSWLTNGRITSADVAHTVGIGHGDVEALAAGKTVIGNKSWQKLAELVASKVH